MHSRELFINSKPTCRLACCTKVFPRKLSDAYILHCADLCESLTLKGKKAINRAPDLWNEFNRPKSKQKYMISTKAYCSSDLLLDILIKYSQASSSFKLKQTADKLTTRYIRDDFKKIGRKMRPTLI